MRQIIDLCEKGKTTEILEENIGEYLHDFRVGKNSSTGHTKSLNIKEKNEKQNITEIKTMCLLKDNKRVKEKPQTGRRYLQYI